LRRCRLLYARLSIGRTILYSLRFLHTRKKIFIF
jgi:hypothetical protein